MNVKAKIGDYFLDISKLIFGGVIISSIVSESINRWVIYSLGAFFSFVLMLVGFVMIDNSENKKKEV
nr:DUF6722 family protein [Parabacteroides goldsteinii]